MIMLVRGGRVAGFFVDRQTFDQDRNHDYHANEISMRLIIFNQFLLIVVSFTQTSSDHQNVEKSCENNSGDAEASALGLTSCISNVAVNNNNNNDDDDI